LLKEHPSDIFLVVASPNYLLAVKEDLIVGATANPGLAQLLVVSSLTKLEGTELLPFLVPSDTSLQQAVGGLRASLHARVARLIVAQAGFHRFNLAAVRASCNALRVDRRQRSARHSTKLSDEAVRAYIRDALATRSAVAYTTLLRKFRATGRACEMTRFKQLYAEERGEVGPHGN
jgi:hypothetical protein